jgi:hypothetical protein
VLKELELVQDHVQWLDLALAALNIGVSTQMLVKTGKIE